MIKAINYRFNTPTVPLSSYDSTKLNLGSLMGRFNNVDGIDNFVGPFPIAIARPLEASTVIAGAYPQVVLQPNLPYDLVFLADNATAAATRRLVLYRFYRSTFQYVWQGFITLTFPTATNHTIRGYRVIVDNYDVGTVGVSGTAVTGSGTEWSTSNMAVGNRIGFGSTDPSQITTWYEISAVGNDTSITLTTSAGTITAGTPYVIENMLVPVATTNATTTNGGLFLVKGLRIENFSNGGTAIPAATTVDNIRAVYWLKDAATIANTTAGSCAVRTKSSWTNQEVYVTNATGSRLFVYNIRKSLTLTSGADTTCLTLSTAAQVLTGTVGQLNNGRIFTVNHGPANGEESLYFTTTTRVYRVRLADLQQDQTPWITDVMVEIPPGGTSTYALTSAMSSVDYSPFFDKIYILTTTNKGYLTTYKTNSEPFEHIFLADTKQLDGSTAAPGSVVHPSINAGTFSCWSDDGVIHLVRNGTTALLNQMYAIPFGAHQRYAIEKNQMIITPKFDISDSTKLYNVIPNFLNRLGEDTYSIPTEPFKMYYRTTGISDNTGEWTELSQTGSLASISATEIQFAFIFKIIGTTCIPSRILGFILTYEDNMTDSHYEPSVSNTSIQNNTFAFRQKTEWGSNIPDMRIRIFNIANSSTVLDDTTVLSSNGTWEYSDDEGVTWNSWDNTQDIVGNYIRYTADSLPGSMKVRIVLTQN